MSCFIKSAGATKDVSNLWQVCPGGDDCCMKGDVCLPQHMCYSFPNNTNKVDYYPAGCTDNSFPNLKCNTGWCENEIAPQLAQWNSNNDSWSCCGVGNLNQPSCGTVTGETFMGPLSQPDYNSIIYHASKLAVGIIVAIVVAAVLVVGCCGFWLFRCCCSRAARDKRNRGKFVPLGSGRDAHGDQVVWNSNMHDQHELHDGPMGGYAAPPHGPGNYGQPQYTVQGFR